MRKFIIVATKEVNSENMYYNMEVRIEVWAYTKNEAMRKVRTEFRHAYLTVEE